VGAARHAGARNPGNRRRAPAPDPRRPAGRGGTRPPPALLGRHRPRASDPVAAAAGGRITLADRPPGRWRYPRRPVSPRAPRPRSGYVLELVKAGGWPMLPLLLLSAVALAIIVERFWTLRRAQVLPPGLGREVRDWVGRSSQLDPAHIESLRGNSPLGALLASVLDMRNHPR